MKEIFQLFLRKSSTQKLNNRANKQVWSITSSQLAVHLRLQCSSIPSHRRVQATLIFLTYSRLINEYNYIVIEEEEEEEEEEEPLLIYTAQGSPFRCNIVTFSYI